MAKRTMLEDGSGGLSYDIWRMGRAIVSYAVLRLPLASRIQLDDREDMEFSVAQIVEQERPGFTWKPGLLLLRLLEAS
jgi:hypothetical protein